MQLIIFKIVLSSLLITAAAIDIKSKGKCIPDYMTVLIMITAIINPYFDIKNSVLGFLCGFMIFYLTYWLNYLICSIRNKITKKEKPIGGIGGADIKITAGFGFAIGSWELVLLACTIAVWGDLIYRTVYFIYAILFRKNKRDKTKPIIFLPFIATGAILCLLLI